MTKYNIHTLILFHYPKEKKSNKIHKNKYKHKQLQKFPQPLNLTLLHVT